MNWADYKKRLNELWCGDSSCVFGRGTGMMTNGGCRCFGSGTWMSKDEAHKVHRKGHLAARLLREILEHLG